MLFFYIRVQKYPNKAIQFWSQFFYYLTWNNNGTEDSYNGYQREEEGRNSAICISIVNIKQLITYNPILKAHFPEPTDILFYIQYDVKRDNWVILQCPES